MKLIWLSDLHFQLSGPLMGIDTVACVDSALEHINRYYADADLCVLSGDLVDKASKADYEALRSRLNSLKMPWFPMVGNHDDRELFVKFMPLPDNAMEHFVQYVLPSPTHDIICLDTLRDGLNDGEVCGERMNWLTTQIEAADGKPVYLFMHHPPMLLDLPMQDFESFVDRERFIEVLSGYANVKHIFAGHVHRAVCGQHAGIPFTTMKSVSVQAPAPYPAWTWETFEPANEAPTYGAVAINGDSVNIQFIEFQG